MIPLVGYLPPLLLFLPLYPTGPWLDWQNHSSIDSMDDQTDHISRFLAIYPSRFPWSPWCFCSSSYDYSIFTYMIVVCVYSVIVPMYSLHYSVRICPMIHINPMGRFPVAIMAPRCPPWPTTIARAWPPRRTSSVRGSCCTGSRVQTSRRKGGLLGAISLGYPLVNYHSYWKWPFTVDIPNKNGDFS